MSAIYDKDRHSRSSSKTDIPDLEKGEARPEKEEEEIIEDNVCQQISYIVVISLTLTGAETT
jgi:hypothetical protein